MNIVETGYGNLQGREVNGVGSFLGVPFAKPPVGALRWKAPEPPEPWTGVRDANEFGPCAIQATMPGDVGELIGIATHETSEDCLYLNVRAPTKASKKLPVMVWIHGGGNTVGAGSQPRVNGERLAAIGEMVVVTINYRLGILGFLHAPELGATGNEALLDQIAALRWVKHEIHNFGGDPNNLTVFGQSAGGFDIAQLMSSPLAVGCFAKAIPMSGSPLSQIDAASAYSTAERVAEKFGGIEKLRSVSANELHALQSQISGARWAPTNDGTVLPEDAAIVLKKGTNTKGMPLMIGHTRDESTLFNIFNPRFSSLSRNDLLRMMGNVFPDDPSVALNCYEDDRRRANLRVEPLDIWSAISTDRMFLIPAIRTAEFHSSHTPDVWMYRFDHESPAHEGRLQSCHSLDIPFVWGTYDIPQMRRFCGEGEHIERISESVMGLYCICTRWRPKSSFIG